MNEVTYIYVVQSDLDEDNIYAEFETEEEALEYAKLYINNLPWITKVEVAVNSDGEIIKIFDDRIIWTYSDEHNILNLDETFNNLDLKTKASDLDLKDETLFKFDFSDLEKFRNTEELIDYLRDVNPIYNKAKDFITSDLDLSSKEKVVAQDLLDYIYKRGVEEAAETVLDADFLNEEIDSVKIINAGLAGQGFMWCLLGDALGAFISGGIGLALGLLVGLVVCKAGTIKNRHQIKQKFKEDPELKKEIKELIKVTGVNDTDKILTWIEEYYANKILNKQSESEDED